MPIRLDNEYISWKLRGTPIPLPCEDYATVPEALQRNRRVEIVVPLISLTWEKHQYEILYELVPQREK